MKYFLAILIIIFSDLGLAVEIRHMNVGSQKNELILDVLKLALSKDSKDYTYQQEADPNANIFRNILKIENKDIDVVWAGTSISLEDKLLPIRIPVLKGMLGYRVFIIRPEDQEKYSQIESLEQLKRLTAGQGTFWEDTRILKENGITTVTTNKFNNLFPMLVGKRYDFFPRGLHEPWVELERFSRYKLAVEKEIILVYPYAMYFFVAKDNQQLADKIESGMIKAIQDGSYDKLFFNSLLIKRTLAEANLANRRIFRLENKALPMNTPLDNKSLWLDFSKLK